MDWHPSGFFNQTGDENDRELMFSFALYHKIYFSRQAIGVPIVDAV